MSDRIGKFVLHKGSGSPTNARLTYKTKHRMMKRTVLIVALSVVTAWGANAQQARQRIQANINLAASNYLAYPGPKKALTPTPKGYEPFYISHYGRHGSRYLIGRGDYDKTYETLQHADSLGKLTARGREVLDKVRMIRNEAMGRDGELTQLGAEQHRQIARRMIGRFPQVFAGETNIDAKSTIVIRCILSMENALQELASINPKLRIRHDASYHDMYYMNDENSRYNKLRDTPEAREAVQAFNRNHDSHAHLMTVLFNDTAFVRSINGSSLANHLLRLAANVQSTELRHKLSLWDIFTEEEVYDFWQRTNAFWYTYYGPSKQAGQAGIYTQVNLLRNILATADSCIRLPHPGATLRYAHESDVMPLVCLLNLNRYGETIDDLEELDDRGWNNFDIYPMGCNVQFIFYKPTKGRLDGADILVKVLLNEDEATLPLSTDCAPYYHWKDVREHYMTKIQGK